MHIIYIEFGISKSNQYKKACNLAKQIPNYKFSDGITQCYIDDIKDYVRVQDIVASLSEKVYKWKNATVLFYDKIYHTSLDYYNFVETLKQNAGKYKIFIRQKNEYNPNQGIVTYEDLPMPVVYYPGHSGGFLRFLRMLVRKYIFANAKDMQLKIIYFLKRSVMSMNNWKWMNLR